MAITDAEYAEAITVESLRETAARYREFIEENKTYTHTAYQTWFMHILDECKQGHRNQTKEVFRMPVTPVHSACPECAVKLHEAYDDLQLRLFVIQSDAFEFDVNE